MALLLWLLLIVPLVQGQVALPVSMIVSVGTGAIKIPESPDEVFQEVASITTSILSKLDPTGITEIITDQQNDAKMQETLTEIMDEITHVSIRINDLSTQLDSKLTAVTEEIMTHHEKFALMRDFRVIYDDIQLYWSEYINVLSTRHLHEDTVSRFASAVIDFNTNSPAASLKKLDSLVNGNQVSDMMPTLPKALLSYYKANELKRCKQGTSDQGDIYNLYNIISMLENQVRIMSIFAYTNKINKRGNYSTEMRQLSTKSRKRMAKYNITMVATMEKASNMIRACDPEDGFKRGESYAEMEGAVQTIAINEYAFGRGVDSCWGACEDKHGRLQEAHYNVYAADNCRNIGHVIHMCPADNKSPRFYDWIEAEDSKRKCPYKVMRIGDWRMSPVCEVCLCRAYNSLKTPWVPVISLFPAMSDFEKNMVVTGVKLNYHNNILRLQVQEGKLGPAGRIFNNSTRWVPMEEIHYKAKQTKPVGQNGTTLYELRHYVTVGAIMRTVNLDNIFVPKDQVVIGMQFVATTKCHMSERLNGNNVSSIYLKVFSAPFDYASGKLHTGWRMGNSEGCPRKEKIKFDNPDIPLNNNINIVRRGADLAVNFQESGMIDYGQTTIPFWDIQEVVTSPSTPLQGVGLIHKGDEEGRYGGYLALVAYPLNPMLHSTYS